MDRNFILALALSMLVFIGFETFIFGPQRKALLAEQQAQAAQLEAAKAEAAAKGETFTEITGETIIIDRAAALAKAPGRVAIDTPELHGSINLAGARIDDLSLKNYKMTLAEDSPDMVLLSPALTEHAFFAQSGVAVNDNSGNQAIWSVVEGDRLTPTSPIVLSRSEKNIVHTLKISVDDRYMFTYDYKLTNESGETVSLRPYGSARLEGFPETSMVRNGNKKIKYSDTFIMHEGPLGVTSDKLFQKKFMKFAKGKKDIVETGIGGWVGLTNKNWFTAVIPPQASEITARLQNLGTPAAPVFGTSYALPQVTLTPGSSKSFSSNIFAGTKHVEGLRAYEAPVEEGGLGIQKFDEAVDWGNFFFLTRPIFNLLHYFAQLTGNYGVAILLLTLVIKGLLFWFANKGYEMTSKMKKVQPELKAVQERYKDDKTKLQTEMMELYKKHKINPVAGCLPILIQMPIFFALYKVLFVTTELRHQPFFGWIQDLSAPDPTSLFNLFGLLPYDPTSLPVVGAFLGIGVLPLLMGIGMWVQMKLNPPPADPMQAQIFGLMPIIFTFLFANFAAGLVLYWFWNTFLGVVQQYAIMKRNGVDVDLLDNIKSSLPFMKAKPVANDNK